MGCTEARAVLKCSFESFSPAAIAFRAAPRHKASKSQGRKPLVRLANQLTSSISSLPPHILSTSALCCRPKGTGNMMCSSGRPKSSSEAEGMSSRRRPSRISWLRRSATTARRSRPSWSSPLSRASAPSRILGKTRTACLEARLRWCGGRLASEMKGENQGIEKKNHEIAMNT